MDQVPKENIVNQSRMLTDFPCLSEKKLVDECYNRTSFNMEACIIPTTNYNACKKFWGTVEQLRRKQNVRPFKPDAEERARIKKYFLEHKELPKFPLEADSL